MTLQLTPCYMSIPDIQKEAEKKVSLVTIAKVDLLMNQWKNGQLSEELAKQRIEEIAESCNPEQKILLGNYYAFHPKRFDCPEKLTVQVMMP